MTFLIGLVIGVLAEQSSLESKNTIDLNGFMYTVTQVFQTERFGLDDKAEGSAS